MNKTELNTILSLIQCLENIEYGVGKEGHSLKEICKIYGALTPTYLMSKSDRIQVVYRTLERWVK